ncbi:MAG: M23 family metallopeptidase [Bacteroidales bacterium]|nr:M23 family metallopeptidase [Bacteroidales bacterium]
MADKKNRKSFLEKFKHKYRLSIYRDETYEEVLNLRLSKLNVFALVGGITILFLAIVISIIAYTPVREFIPGYPDENTIVNIQKNKILLDSLEIEMNKRDKYFENIRRILSGEDPENYDNYADTNVKPVNIEFSKSSDDSILRQMIAQEEQFNISHATSKRKSSSISTTHFFSPIKGLVTNTFNTTSNHYGIDVVAEPNAVVKATLDGTVIMSSWTLETGWVIQVQHDNNLLSVYKHNAELLKRQGDFVKAGDPIAIIGNSGELTTGPHLHFELWHNMTPINPLDYIVF